MARLVKFQGMWLVLAIILAVCFISYFWPLFNRSRAVNDTVESGSAILEIKPTAIQPAVVLPTGVVANETVIAETVVADETTSEPVVVDETVVGGIDPRAIDNIDLSVHDHVDLSVLDNLDPAVLDGFDVTKPRHRLEKRGPPYPMPPSDDAADSTTNVIDALTRFMHELERGQVTVESALDAFSHNARPDVTPRMSAEARGLWQQLKYISASTKDAAASLSMLMGDIQYVREHAGHIQEMSESAKTQNSSSSISDSVEPASIEEVKDEEETTGKQMSDEDELKWLMYDNWY